MYSDKTYFLTKINETELNKLTGTSDTNLEKAIMAADSLIDSYAVNVTTIPMTAPPEIVKQLSYDIAVFYLHDRIQYSDIPERVKDKYDAAVNYLKDIASGKANLGVPAEAAETGIYSESEPSVFNRSTF